jgi:hypothetical protein
MSTAQTTQQTSARSAEQALGQWLENLPPETVRQLARKATEGARSLGLVVLRDVGDIDIPLSLTPEVIHGETLQQRAQDASNVLLGVIRTVRHVMSEGLDAPRAQLLFRHFGPLERQALANWQKAEDVTIARVDWFLDAAGTHHALELNATIPAMEAYSDAAARAWIETIGEAAGLSKTELESLVAANGSNAEELRQSILAHAGYRADATPSMAMLHREADSQVRELQALARHFAARGHQVRLATPSQVTLDSDGQVRVEGFEQTPDILYRHIFARRMPPGSALERIALGETASRLQNPVNGQHEVKGVLAELSRIVAEENGKGLDLSEEQRASIARVVPWTRVLSRDASLTPDGERVADLSAYVILHPERFVVKKSWDYGGKSVHLGPEVVAHEGMNGWRQKVEAALADGPGAFVVQQFVSSPKKRHLVVSADGATTWEEVYVDASSYSATGSRAVPGGGVVRFARVGVVNIVGGGGVAPLITTEVAERLLAALAATT